MFQEHRKRFLAQLAREDAAAIVPTGAVKLRNHDSEYRFRPRSDFYYLTGFREPDAVLVLVPHHAEADCGAAKSPVVEGESFVLVLSRRLEPGDRLDAPSREFGVLLHSGKRLYGRRGAYGVLGLKAEGAVLSGTLEWMDGTLTLSGTFQAETR